jgi:hypothetical protein
MTMGTKANVAELLQLLVDRIKELPETQKYTADYKHAYQFEPEGVEPFYLQVDHGKLTVHSGVLKGDFTVKSTLRTDAATLRDMLVGKLKPLDAADQGKWLMQSRAYAGNLLMVLMRINQDKVIEGLLAAL